MMYINKGFSIQNFDSWNRNENRALKDQWDNEKICFESFNDNLKTKDTKNWIGKLKANAILLIWWEK